MEQLKPLAVEVNRVKPLVMGGYESRMILDHVITGRDNVVQINHGVLKKGEALSGAAHDDDEIYYILSGTARLKLGDELTEVHPNQVIFIPAGCFHALDNSEGTEDLKILTFWRNYKANEAYEERIKQWGTSFKTIDEE